MRRLAPACLIPLALALALAACRPASPVDIDTRADSCSRCRMAIDQVVHAAEAITASGDILRYDSLGCLAADYREGKHGMGPGTRDIFVIDYGTRRWIAARSAHYALADLPTDHMGFGAAATARREDALALVGGDSAKVIGWERLVSRNLERR